MSLFKDLYGQAFLVPYRFVDPNLPMLVAKNTLEEMDRQLQVIKETLKRESDKTEKLCQFTLVFLGI